MSKLPKEIVELAAKTLHARNSRENYSGSWEFIRTTILADMYRRDAIAVLRAIGLTATEEWGTQAAHYANPAHSESQARHWVSLDPDQPLVHRFVMSAETPWEKVTDE